MRKTRREGMLRLHTTWAVALAVGALAGISAPARATMRYGALQLSGNVETQNLIRHQSPDELQFVQNRNTLRVRLDLDLVQSGSLLNTLDIPFIDWSKVFLLYRGAYDGFYDIAPGGRQVGQERLDDIVGGPINGNQMGTLAADGRLKHGLYSRLTDSDRTDLKFENTVREAYIDLKLKSVPLSFRLGRQQVIWGESDQFRLMDIWNPLDITWHAQQESWDNIRIPLWLAKGLWDIGQLGPLSNSFLEVVYNPGDFQANLKLDYLPRPWAMPFPNPIRSGQLLQTPLGLAGATFDMQGTTFRHGDFDRNPSEASEIGARFHAVTPQGVEFTVNYLNTRARKLGAGNPLALKIDEVDLIVNRSAGTFAFADQPGNPLAASTALVRAKTRFPYTHIVGLTANYFEDNFTNSVLRLETAYTTDSPFQTVEEEKLPTAKLCIEAAGTLNCSAVGKAGQGYDTRAIWAGMLGFDRPTWIRFLNDKSTWLLSGQFFWSYIPGNVSLLRGATSGAAETPYFTPQSGPGSHSLGVGTWQTGPYAGAMERVQAGSCLPGAVCLGHVPDPSGDIFHRWEHLLTFAAQSFYRGGTVVPFFASAWDPVNANVLVNWAIDYYHTNNFIITLQQKFYATYGSNRPSDDPWEVGGLLDRRDETGIKLTYQF
ncbi:MAG: DUF1302 family protein [Candidatus Binatia bacterium]